VEAKNGKKRAILAVARKLEVLLHHFWISCEAYESRWARLGRSRLHGSGRPL
jgi:hypothetical protein